ncbi:hypothetical protein BDF20DRAFT_835889 [Mycotypha africana]|uniref:uncharacterized protein n=1 Tax=Mycotypha africana TaxID=64632 RepID=UPI002301DD82|nr:uncharacterized protein BDF20DRAFT_835889 [Mycotypha africana]KAI8977055.1 hypothetical protein BDF20DRAFT_835889 [Mycotypha africana]
MAQIYKATYSGVPVYEFVCNNVAVMRRRDDSYLNATQILKVAEFDKPQRTKILEREVQTGQHEKVQGGYGKYQGTWVPFERGVALAQHYQVDNLLRPLFDFVKGDQSPPLAPKHVTAASNRPRKPRSTEPKRKKVIIKRFADPTNNLGLQPYYHHHQPHLPYSDMAYSNYNGLPFNLLQEYSSSMMAAGSSNSNSSGNQSSKKRSRQEQKPVNNDEDMDIDDLENHDSLFPLTADQSYAHQLLQYFISDDAAVIPHILLNPPNDLDVNVIIDDEGHTSLHWAAAMGRLQLVQILINLGADIYRVNYKGQTALMRSVLFTNNFDSKSFLFLIDMLKGTMYNIDKKDQTVFHHVAATASWKGKVHASRYYMECLIECMRKNDLATLLNVQDVYGDTALSIAARIGNKKLVRLLLEAGANAEIPNEEGMTAQDYITEAERNNRFQPPMQPMAANDSSSSSLPYQQQSSKSEAEYRKDLAARTRLRQNIEGLFKKILVNDRAQPPLASHLFDGFAGNYERELVQKDHIIKEKRNELEVLRKRLAGTKHTLDQIQYDPSRVEIVQKENERLSSLLSELMYRVQKERLRTVKEECLNKLEKEDEKGKKSAFTSEDLNEVNVEVAETNTKQSQQTLSSESTNDAITTDHPFKKPKTTSGTESLEMICLLDELKSLRELRKKRTEELENLIKQTPSKRHQEYKRLISMCCNVAYENVDLMLLPLLSSFDELIRAPTQQQQQQQQQENAYIPSSTTTTSTTTAASTPITEAAVALQPQQSQQQDQSLLQQPQDKAPYAATSSTTPIITVESQRHHQTETMETDSA